MKYVKSLMFVLMVVIVSACGGGGGSGGGPGAGVKIALTNSDTGQPISDGGTINLSSAVGYTPGKLSATEFTDLKLTPSVDIEVTYTHDASNDNQYPKATPKDSFIKFVYDDSKQCKAQPTAGDKCKVATLSFNPTKVTDSADYSIEVDYTYNTNSGGSTSTSGSMTIFVVNASVPVKLFYAADNPAVFSFSPDNTYKFTTIDAQSNLQFNAPAKDTKLSYSGLPPFQITNVDPKGSVTAKALDGVHFGVNSFPKGLLKYNSNQYAVGNDVKFTIARNFVVTTAAGVYLQDVMGLGDPKLIDFSKWAANPLNISKIIFDRGGFPFVGMSVPSTAMAVLNDVGIAGIAYGTDKLYDLSGLKPDKSLTLDPKEQYSVLAQAMASSIDSEINPAKIITLLSDPKSNYYIASQVNEIKVDPLKLEVNGLASGAKYALATNADDEILITVDEKIYWASFANVKNNILNAKPVTPVPTVASITTYSQTGYISGDGVVNYNQPVQAVVLASLTAQKDKLQFIPAGVSAIDTKAIANLALPGTVMDKVLSFACGDFDQDGYTKQTLPPACYLVGLDMSSDPNHSKLVAVQFNPDSTTSGTVPLLPQGGTSKQLDTSSANNLSLSGAAVMVVVDGNSGSIAIANRVSGKGLELFQLVDGKYQLVTPPTPITEKVTDLGVY